MALISYREYYDNIFFSRKQPFPEIALTIIRKNCSTVIFPSHCTRTNSTHSNWVTSGSSENAICCEICFCILLLEAQPSAHSQLSVGPYQRTCWLEGISRTDHSKGNRTAVFLTAGASMTSISN